MSNQYTHASHQIEFQGGETEQNISVICHVTKHKF